MSRDRTGPQVAADTGAHAGGVPLIELNFTGGTLRFCMGPSNITVGADTYLTQGDLLTIEDQTESADGTEGMTFTLSGLNAGIFNIMASEPYKGKLVRLLELRYDADQQPVDPPTVEWMGLMVQMASNEDPDSRTRTITLQAEHFEADSERPTNLRFSDAEQRRRYPDDKGAEYVTSMTDRVLRRGTS